MFDSIRTDLNSRLLISNKATTSEAQTGTNDTKYMTPLKVQQKLNSLVRTVSFVGGKSETEHTILDTTNYAGKVITIIGCIRADSNTNNHDYTKGEISISGTFNYGIQSWDTNIGAMATESFAPFSMTIDMNSKTITGVRTIYGTGASVFSSHFSSIGSVKCYLKSVNTTNRRTYCDATIIISS